jgi:hypothetical protein
MKKSLNKTLAIIALVVVLPLGVLLSSLLPVIGDNVSQNSELPKSELEKCRELYSQKTKGSWLQAYESTCSELAKNGNGEAQYYLGMIIKSSPNIPDYKAAAYSFFYVANENGDRRGRDEIEKVKKLMGKKDLSISYIMLGNDSYSEYLKSGMLKKDDKRSFKFLGLSSEFGSTVSQYNLCLSYSVGFHGKFKFSKNYIEAYKWCSLANLDPKIKSNEKSQKVFAKLKSLMTEAQITQGNKLVEEWIGNNQDPSLVANPTNN